MSETPKTFGELFQFYYDFVKLLYSQVQTTNKLPDETLFEINAAFDHVSKHWCYGEPEERVVAKAYSHLKRSCLDIFKLEVKETRDQYEELLKIDTSILDNGKFDGQMRRLLAEIKAGATEARRVEGRIATDENAHVKAFDHWLPVYEKCMLFEKEYYGHPDIEWAKKLEKQAKAKEYRISLKKFVWSIITTALVTAFLKDPLAGLLQAGWHYLQSLFTP